MSGQASDDIVNGLLGDDFFGGEPAPEMVEAIEAESVEVSEMPPMIEAPKEDGETSQGEFVKVSDPDGFPQEPVPFTPPEEVPNEELKDKAENVENPEDKAEIPQEDSEAPVTHQEDITMTTTVVDTKQGGNPEEQQEVLATVQFEGVPAKVFFKKGLTRNLGNFESYRVDVGIEMPCKPEDAKKYVLEGGKVVEHRLAMEMQKAQRLYGNAGGSVFDKVNVNL